MREGWRWLEIQYNVDDSGHIIKIAPPIETTVNILFWVFLLDRQSEIKASIDALLLRKQQTDEQVPIARIAGIDKFLTQELARLQEAAKLLPSASGDSANLDRLFRHCLGVLE